MENSKSNSEPSGHRKNFSCHMLFTIFTFQTSVVSLITPSFHSLNRIGLLGLRFYEVTVLRVVTDEKSGYGPMSLWDSSFPVALENFPFLHPSPQLLLQSKKKKKKIDMSTPGMANIRPVAQKRPAGRFNPARLIYTLLLYFHDDLWNYISLNMKSLTHLAFAL